MNEVTFTGSVSDPSSGLQYMNARFYNPGTGRFLTQDAYSGSAYDPWTQHLYSYCGNNPTNMIDPTGHRAMCVEIELDYRFDREPTTLLSVASSVETAVSSVGIGVIEVAFPGSMERNEKKFDSVYDFSNYLTLGYVGTIKGSVSPEVPLSFDHWLDAAATVAICMPFVSKAMSITSRLGSKAVQGAGKTGAITNDILGKPRVGSALKLDDYHAFNNIVDNYAGSATKTGLNNGAMLYQIEGSLNGVSGRFEWITQSGNVTHRMFVPGGTMSGVPIKP